MTINKRALLKKLDEIDRLEKLSDDLMDTDEDASDEAYAQMWAVAREVADEIIRLTSGQIEKNIALKMVFHKREKIKDLVRRLA